MKKVKCFNIKWDAPKSIIKRLPKSVLIEVSDEYDDDELADELSDKVGFCMYSFNFTEING